MGTLIEQKEEKGQTGSLLLLEPSHPFSALVLRLSHSHMDSYQQLPDYQAFRLRLNYIIGFLVL